jgi:hypothetical protein
VRIAILSALLTAGCWSTAAPVSTAPPIVFSPPPPRTPDPPSFSVWEGRYVCTQGPTAMRLTISVKPDGTARVRFDFRALPENPGVPTGAYQLIGSMLLNSDGTLELRASPDQWFDQPSGYQMVGLRAQSDAAHRTLTGRITHENCGELELVRLETPRARPR